MKPIPRVHLSCSSQGPWHAGKGRCVALQMTAARPSLHTALYHATLSTAGKHQWGNPGPCSLESLQLVTWAEWTWVNLPSVKKKKTKPKTFQTQSCRHFSSTCDYQIPRTEPSTRQDSHPLPHPERTYEVGGISKGHALLVKGALFSLMPFLLQLTSSLQVASNEEWQTVRQSYVRKMYLAFFFF